LSLLCPYLSVCPICFYFLFLVHCTYCGTIFGTIFGTGRLTCVGLFEIWFVLEYVPMVPWKVYLSPIYVLFLVHCTYFGTIHFGYYGLFTIVILQRSFGVVCGLSSEYAIPSIFDFLAHCTYLGVPF
jgi:hypothetical protein